MFNRINSICLSLSMLLINGCSSTINKISSPPEDTKWVNVEVKNPLPYTAPFPLEVRYISYKCKKKRISGFDGSVITEPSYNVISVPLQQQSDDIWKVKVATIGGGTCKWSLSAITLGIEYIDATHIEKDLVPGTAVGAEIAFDNDASRNGTFNIIVGNRLTYSPQYYPLIKRWKNEKEPGMVDKLYLFGKENAFWNVHLDINKNQEAWILYHPKINESKKVEMIFPNDNKEGATYNFLYPNGEKIPSREINPDFNKLEKIK
ncbi:hypothetical protein [Erwinia sp. CGal63]|uniref:hypothetical protein n=1 Tax=Erwinia sp. CGal63 TaxID=2919889 RepID=UPI0030081BE2